MAWFGTMVAAAALVGCAGQSNSNSAIDNPAARDFTPAKGSGRNPSGKQLLVGVVFDSGGLGDKSFNDSAWAGVQRAVKQLGIDEKHIESKSEKDFEGNLTAMADAGCDIVFAIGITQQKALEAVAPKYPNVKFGIVDANVSAPNVRSLLFTEQEGSFLAGYLAALTTQSKKVGFVGGMDIPLIRKFQAGYEAGVKTADPSVEVLPGKYTGNWDDQGKGKVCANTLFASGADIVYHAAGRAGLGVISAAKEQKKLAIGVDSDQDDVEKGFVLTSMIKRVDEAVFQTVKDLSEGKFTAGSKVYDLKAGGVGLSEMKYTKDKVGKDNLEKLKAVTAKIIKGEIKVPSNSDELAKYEAQLKK
ncbi:MAG TPA: BMP family ABC transporter substrate-binding protein [Fimbriimonadaceae bacterium]|nr:BMP family ABC transporter substrate-binding protein [Fimbriimonadaceae bacterium]